MGDKPNVCGGRVLHPDYERYVFEFIVPRDLSMEEVLRVLNRCLAKYVAEHSRIGYRSPFYVEEECTA